MIIYLSGEDTFRSRERLKQLRDAFVKKYDPSGMNVVLLDGTNLKFEQFQQSVVSSGFLSSRRFVVVDRPFEGDIKTQEAVAEFIREKKVPEETIVVFWSGEETKPKRSKQVDATSSLPGILEKVKNSERFDTLEPLEVERWIVKRAKERGGSIERAAAERLAAIVGTDLWLAANELEKLVHQKQGQPIMGADIEADIHGKLEANIFEFTDALSRKDRSGALASLERHFASGANELYLLTMIARQLRILISIADIATTEPSPATIASRLSLHPFVVKKGLAQIRTFSQSELIRAHDEIVFIDHRLKNSRDNARALLEVFVLRLCSLDAVRDRSGRP